MTKVTCIRCGEVFELPEGRTTGQCPVCGQKVEKFVSQAQIDLGRLLQRIPLLLKQGEWGKARQCCELLLKDSPADSFGHLYHYMARNHFRDFRRLGYDAADNLSASTDIQRALEFADNDLRSKLEAQIVFQDRLRLLGELRRGNAVEGQMTSRLRKDLDELWEQADGSEKVVELFQQRLEREFTDYVGLLQRQLQTLATSNTAESERQFETLANKLMAIGRRGGCPAAARFAEEGLPELRERRKTAQFNDLLNSVPRDDEAWDDFYPRLRKLFVEMNSLAKLNCKEAREFLKKDFQELCFRRACVEESQKHYERAITLYQYCSGTDAASHLDNCVKRLDLARNVKKICVAAGCLIVAGVALFGMAKWRNARALDMLAVRWQQALVAEDLQELAEVLAETTRRGGGKNAAVVRKCYADLKEYYSKRLEPILGQVRQDFEKQNFPAVEEGLRKAEEVLDSCQEICGQTADDAIVAWLGEKRTELSSFLKHHAVFTKNSTSDKADAAPGETVTVTTNLPKGTMPSDYEFAWSSTPAVEFAVVDELTRSFTMPSEPVSVTCKATRKKTYAVTVTGANADKAEAARGETVTIIPILPQGAKVSDYEFAWSSVPTVQFEKKEFTASFTMPAEPVSVTCMALKTYAVTVIGGSANKATAVPGETVTVTANLPDGALPSDYEFKWSCVPAVEFSFSGATATFSMPPMAVKVTYMATRKFTGNTNLYLVVDLSGGPKARHYTVRYSKIGPKLSSDTCRTKELWLRRIPKGTFPMGSPENELGRDGNETQHQVTLTQDYYIGVFEVTQRQYELVMGSKPSYYIGATRPVEGVSYNELRGTSVKGGAGWPARGHVVDANSFFGKLQQKTGLTFDLPTEAQWEYACRAGTTTALNSGKDLISTGQCPNMTEVGRYYYNRLDGKGGYSQHTEVGSYLPNAWGLYDMHGNVWEWCLDWSGPYPNALVTDPSGPSSGSSRVDRGGGWNGGDWYGGAQYCRSAYRDSLHPSRCYGSSGFRVVCLP